MVVTQIVATNVQLYFNTRYINLSYIGWVKFQIFVISLLYFFASAATSVSRQILQLVLPLPSSDFETAIMLFVTSGFLFLLIIGIFVWRFPKTVGLRKTYLSIK
jgi:hypothetical protein